MKLQQKKENITFCNHWSGSRCRPSGRPFHGTNSASRSAYIKQPRCLPGVGSFERRLSGWDQTCDNDWESVATVGRGWHQPSHCRNRDQIYKSLIKRYFRNILGRHSMTALLLRSRPVGFMTRTISTETACSALHLFGAWYGHFPQVEDEEVRELLSQAQQVQSAVAPSWVRKPRGEGRNAMNSAGSAAGGGTDSSQHRP